MDNTNPPEVNIQEVIDRLSAGGLTENDTIQMLNTIMLQMQRADALIKILMAAVNSRATAQQGQVAEPTAAPMQVSAEEAVPLLSPVSEIAPPTQIAPEQETVSSVLENEGRAINYHSVALALMSPNVVKEARGNVHFPTHVERIEPHSPDIIPTILAWPTGFYDGGRQTLVKLGSVALLWEHPNGVIAYADLPKFAFSMPDGSFVELSKVEKPDMIRAVIMDIAAATHATIINAAKL